MILHMIYKCSAIVTFYIHFTVFKLSFQPLILKTVFKIVMTQLEQQITKQSSRAEAKVSVFHTRSVS